MYSKTYATKRTGHCSKCLYGLPINDGVKFECHRNPPTVFDDDGAVFPVVAVMDAWCGEFVAKDGRDES